MTLNKGFTLLEVLIVVIIIGILASIALPQYTNAIEKARAGEAVANIGALRSSLDRYWCDKGNITTDPNLLDIGNPNSNDNRLYNYTITNQDTNSSIRKYTITATRSGKSEFVVQWIQNGMTGTLSKSDNLK